MQAVAPLPALRDELALYPGPVGHDGAPTWLLHDPLRNQFFRLTWPAFEVLSRWHLGHSEAIAQSVSSETTLALDAADVNDVVEFLAGGQLLKPSSGRDVARLLAIHDAHKTGWLTWALHHYLFFRVPLVRPDQWLDAILPFVEWMGRRSFRLITLGVLVVGLFGGLLILMRFLLAD